LLHSTASLYKEINHNDHHIFIINIPYAMVSFEMIAQINLNNHTLNMLSTTPKRCVGVPAFVVSFCVNFILFFLCSFFSLFFFPI